MRTEWLILADAAQIVGGKLFLMGGGWDMLTANRPFPVTQHCAIAVSYVVPWTETNQQFSVEVVIVSDDGKELGKIQGQVEAGRPPGTPPGSEQRTQIAAELNLEFTEPGSFAIISSVGGFEDLRTAFRVVAGPGS